MVVVVVVGGGGGDDSVGQVDVSERHLGSPADVRVPEQTDDVDDEHAVTRRHELEVGQLHGRPDRVAHLHKHTHTPSLPHLLSFKTALDHRVKYIFYLESIRPIKTAENFEGDWLLQQKWLHCGINRHSRRSSDVILRHFVEVSK